METSWLPALLLVWITALAGTLDARQQARFVQLCTGLVFARGRRTVTRWLRACGVGRDYKRVLVLQRKEFDPLVPGHPGLGVGLSGGLVAADVVLHQQQRQFQGQSGDLDRSLKQPHGPVQRQLRRFFPSTRRVSVMNK